MHISGKTLAIGGGLAAAMFLGVIVYKAWPATVPDIVLQDSEGDAVTLTALQEGKEHLVAVFLLPGCPVSKFSLGVVSEQYERWSARAAFVGLHFGTQDAAAQFQESEEVPFEVYGLRSATDPFAVNELIEAVGSSYGLGSAVYGGTVVVIDRDRSVVLSLEKEDVRELPAKLADLFE